MPLLNACDFAFPRGDITIEEYYRLLYAAGVRVVQRYLWRGGKGVTKREIAAAQAVGIRIVYGYEGYASNWRGGAAQGVKDAVDANAIADELGLPVGEPIYYAVDEDAAGMGKIHVAVAYVEAANTPKHPARGYGQYALAEALKLPTFQTYAWSAGWVSKYAALYQWHNGQQLAGGSVDYCEIRDAAALGIGPHPSPWEDNEVISPDGMKQISDLLDAKLTEGIVRARSVDLVLGGDDSSYHRFETLLSGFPGFKTLAARGLALVKKGK